MGISRTCPLIFLLALTTISTLAVDFKLDTTFLSPMINSDTVSDILVLPDGKVFVAGQVNGPGSGTGPYVKRLNPDGSIDPTFNASGITPAAGNFGEMRRIYLVNSKLVIEGYFNVNGVWARFARLNLDGSVDTSLTTSTQSNIRAVQADGKLISCGDRIFGSETYKIAHRLNENGTHDPTFRITWADAGFCAEVVPLPDGKFLMTGELTVGGQPLKSLRRLNSDGSLDPTFDAPVGTGTSVGRPTVLANGKILVTSNQMVKRLLQNGALDIEIPLCSGGAFLPQPDGSFYMSGCKKWNSPSAVVFHLAKVFENGDVDQKLDYMTIFSIGGIRDAGNGALYVYGSFTAVNGASQRRIARLIPDNSPTKARYDFDGDGRSDLAVFRPSEGVWYLNQSTAGFRYQQWGFSTDRIAAGDANWDNKTDIGVFRDGAWHALVNGNHQYMCLGAAGDKPLVSRHNGNLGSGDVFIARGFRNGSLLWYQNLAYSNCWFSSQQPQPFLVTAEVSSDKPVSGDFNGDSRSELGYFRDGYWYSIDRDNYTGPSTFQWGSQGDIPVPGDYDGDRQADYAVFRPSTGTWWINQSTNGVIALRFGQNGDIPVPADYDGDGKIDIAIYRDGVWWQYRSSNGSVHAERWGVNGDIPIPAQEQF